MKNDRSKIQTCTIEDVQSISPVEAAYEETELGSGVMNQASEVLYRFDPVTLKLHKNLQNVTEDIKYAEMEIQELEKSLDKMLAEFDVNDKSADRKIRRLESQIEVKMTLVDTLRKREKSYKSKITNFLEVQNMFYSSDAPVEGTSSDVAVSSETTNILRSRSVPVLPAKNRQKGPARQPQDQDDSDLMAFKKRIRKNHRAELLEIQLAAENGEVFSKPEDHVLDGGLTVPGGIWSRLYDYQREGVIWLWNLHQNGIGGIIGDEMGLGKTIQIIAFLAALRHSGLSLRKSSFEVAVSQMTRHYRSSHEKRMSGLGPVLIVCPGTVLNQWLTEFRAWIPNTRVVILHSSGAGYNNVPKVIKSLFETSGIVLTTYGTLSLHRDLLLPLAWHYLILDEGHKIKNSEADITLTVKRFATPHKLIASGTPMQNNLKELWSIFDFIYPGKLGGLVDFLQNFGVPITQGGYANSSPTQVEIAYRCACTLKNLLSPYLLRRLKSEVSLQLPKKSEQVLFCRLTNYQRCVYEEYLNSRECLNIIKGQGLAFKGLIVLRGLCNHPDLITGGPRHFGSRYGEEQDDLLTGHFDATAETSKSDWDDFGCPRRSGKLMVTLDLLRIWHDQGHKVLIFTQSRRMLRLIEKQVLAMNFSYLKMDGTTSMAQRPKLIEKFNSSPHTTCFVFLLTTRVGGLGVNLIGANRVLIFDPDWNPSTDAQARERAWRIGQTRDVIVYRLLTSGTIDEKIYQRQIFKQFLTNRVLKNPRQQRFFKINDLSELFTLRDRDVEDSKNGCSSSESMAFFRGMGIDNSTSGRLSSTLKNRFDQMLANKSACKAMSPSSSSESEPLHEQEPPTTERSLKDREARLRSLARKLSRQLIEEKQAAKDTRQSRKRAHGAKVDGHRIRLVDRRSDFDEGNDGYDDLAEENSSSKRWKCSKSTGAYDPFVASVLCRPSRDKDATPDETAMASRMAEIDSKRSAVDAQTAREAIRVAEAALEGISAQPPSRPPKVHRHHHGPLKKTSRNRIGHQNKLHLSSSSSLPSLRGVTAVDHDRLMSDYLLSSRSVDPTFGKLQAGRLASSVVAWLNTQALSVGQLGLASDVSATTCDSKGLRFGLLKQRFLWNPKEESSPYYASMMKSEGVQTASILAKTGEGHNRLSSCLLLQLIRVRRDRSMSLLGLSAASLIDTSSSSSRDDGNGGGVNCLLQLERRLRSVAIDLLRVFTDSETSTSVDKLTTSTRVLGARFNQILSTNDDTVDKESLCARHFRALLRAVSVPALRPSGSNSTRHDRRTEDVWELKPQFVSVARRLALDPSVFII